MTDELASIPCLACGGERFDVLLTPTEIEREQVWLREFFCERIEGSLKDHADFTQSTPVFVLRCLGCGTVMRNPQPTPQSLHRLYRFDSYGKRTLEGLLESERGFFRSKAASIDLPKDSRILEVGCFVGAFLLAAQERGWRATGVDIGKETCEFVRGMGLSVHEGELGGLDGRFDAIFVWNTFDQVNRPGDLLKHARRLLAPGGRLVLRVNNGAFETAALECRRKKGERIWLAQAYNNFLAYPYLVGYTEASLTQLLNRYGIEVEQIVGDTILPLATPDTKPEAVEEEQRVKRLVVRFCRRYQKERLYPWLDVHARAPSS